jgi:hypothetical protein
MQWEAIPWVPTPAEITAAWNFLKDNGDIPGQIEPWRAGTVDALMESGKGQLIIQECMDWLKGKGMVEFLRNRDQLIKGFVGGSLSSAFQLGLLVAALHYLRQNPRK